MPLIAIGLNHLSAPVEVRECLVPFCATGFTESARTDGANLEIVLINTCNRIEMYLFGSLEIAKQTFQDWLKTSQIPSIELEKCLYQFEDTGAVKHLFRVASGLDSMVLGENQILHQVKDCYQNAVNRNTVGKQLHSLFQKALEVGRRVRSETKISENTVSIASTSVDLAQRIFGSLSDCTALIIGAGEMAALVAKHLKSRDIGKLIFTNRTFEKAEALSSEFDGQAAPFSDLSTLLIETDLVISSTGAPKPILCKQTFEAALSRRPFRPIFAIDIAVPRDIEPGCNELENLYLYDIDDLQGVVDENIGKRRIEAEKAETIVAYETNAFKVAFDAFSVVPLIRALRENVDQMRINELERFLSRHKDLSPQIIEAFDQCTRAIMAKWLHHPTVALKEKGSSEMAELEAIAKLFGLSSSVLPRAPLVSVDLKEVKKV